MTGTKKGARVQQGLRANLRQFLLLALINVFVGGMVGLERAVLPLIGQEEFGLVSAAAALSFIVTFGFSKAVANFFAGRIADQIGRKRLLILGWLVGVPVPLMVMWAPNWSWVVVANILLGVNQAFAWSMTVNMKIDLVGPARRGFALGINEFAGYLGVAIFTLASGYIAEAYGLRPEPFYLGIAAVAAGLALGMLVRDTGDHLLAERTAVDNRAVYTDDVEKGDAGKREPETKEVSLAGAFHIVTWKDRAVSSASLAGVITNGKDGMAWGLFPLFFASAGLAVAEIGIIVAVYPAAWAVFQLVAGPLSDRVGRKWMIATGMLTQGVSIWWILLTQGFVNWFGGAVALGIGTALVYPTLQAAVADVAHPSWRASALGVYRFWRDAGYALGALAAGTLADVFSVRMAMGLVGLLPILAALVVAMRMYETHPRGQR